jgi:hypothetical protein
MLCEQILRSPVLGQSSLASVVAHLKMMVASKLAQAHCDGRVVARWVMARWVVRAVVGTLVVRGAHAQNSVERPNAERVWTAAQTPLTLPPLTLWPIVALTPVTPLAVVRAAGAMALMAVAAAGAM